MEIVFPLRLNCMRIRLIISGFQGPWFHAILLMTPYSFENLKSHIRPWSFKVVASVHKPLECTDEKDDAECDNTVIYIQLDKH